VIGFSTRNVTYPLHDDAGNLKQIYVPGVSPAYDHTFSYDEMGRFEKIFVTGGTLLSNIITTRPPTRHSAIIFTAV
jgi:hypothetical protein